MLRVGLKSLARTVTSKDSRAADSLITLIYLRDLPSAVGLGLIGIVASGPPLAICS